MKIISVITIGTLFLTGCQATAPIMKNSVSFVVLYPSGSYVYKNNWPLCGNFSVGTPQGIESGVRLEGKYITNYQDCKVDPEGYIPKQIVIEYAPWLTYEQQVKAGMGNSRTVFKLDDIPLDKQPSLKTLIAYDTANEKKIEAAIDKLPASAWKKIALHPPKDVEKYKYQLPEGDGNPRRGKEIHYTISLKPDGTYSIKTELYWKSPYQKYWN